MACTTFGGKTNFTVDVDLNLSSVFPNVTVYFYTYTHGIGVVLDLAEASFRQKRYIKYTAKKKTNYTCIYSTIHVFV